MGVAGANAATGAMLVALTMGLIFDGVFNENEFGASALVLAVAPRVAPPPREKEEVLGAKLVGACVAPLVALRVLKLGEAVLVAGAANEKAAVVPAAAPVDGAAPKAGKPIDVPRFAAAGCGKPGAAGALPRFRLLWIVGDCERPFAAPAAPKPPPVAAAPPKEKLFAGCCTPNAAVAGDRFALCAGAPKPPNGDGAAGAAAAGAKDRV